MFLDYKDITSREAYEYYRENRKITSKTIDQYNYFKKAVGGIFILIKDMMLKNEQGVCVRDLGYFYMLRTKNKIKRIQLHQKSILKRWKTDYEYIPHYLPDIMYLEWNMDHSFSREFVARRKKSRGKQYKMSKTICDSVIVSEDFMIKAEKNKRNSRRNKNYKKESRK